MDKMIKFNFGWDNGKGSKRDSHHGQILSINDHPPWKKTKTNMIMKKNNKHTKRAIAGSKYTMTCTVSKALQDGFWDIQATIIIPGNHHTITYQKHNQIQLFRLVFCVEHLHIFLVCAFFWSIMFLQTNPHMGRSREALHPVVKWTC